MKKILTIFLIVIILTGCNNNTPRKAVEKFLKRYKTLDSEVLVDLEEIVEKENLNREGEEKYREVLKKQYKDLEFKIKEEEVSDDIDYVTVEITVYDLYKAKEDALYYKDNNLEQFKDSEGNYDENKYTLYKLDKMKDTTKRVNYEIIFTVTKEDDEYVVMQPTENDLLKIHGIYNSDLD